MSGSSMKGEDVYAAPCGWFTASTACPRGRYLALVRRVLLVQTICTDANSFPLLPSDHMKSLSIVLLLMGFMLPARGQFHASPAPTADASLSAQPVIREALSPSVTEQPFSFLASDQSLGLTPYLDGLRAPSVNEEFPATVPLLAAPFVTAPTSRPVDTYRVRSSSVGGWLLRGVAETICANATTPSTWGAAQCNGIGRRTYGYPRFRSTRYK